ncbi:MAG: ATP-dependent helicase C-terminal domain-containing protein [Opitutales bacterium]
MESIKNLPVFKEFQSIRDAWAKHRHLVLKSPTGSGKSIALPFLLAESGLVGGRILVSQPRRIAARTLAKQVAHLANWTMGQEVGYEVRFEKQSSPRTQILYATDGIVLNKLLSRNGLENLEVLILDEFHERSAHIDLCLTQAIRLCESYPKLRIIVTSATLDLGKVTNFIPHSVPLELTGKSFPVEIEHKAIPSQNTIWKSVSDLLPKLLNKFDGDVLIFMDGAYEITKTIQAILGCPWSNGIEVRPLFGDLSVEKQDLALQRSKNRKIIVSTNIAETSLTIEGITVVIDTGKAKKMRFDSKRGINVLLSEPISKSSADQRAGRAGRLKPGYCLRLWSKSVHDNRPDFDSPEISYIDLSEIYLNLRSADIKLENIKLLDPISQEAISDAQEKLQSLGALNRHFDLTPHGEQMSNLPIHPTWAHALLIAKENDAVPVIALLLAILDGRSFVQSGNLVDFYQMRKPRSDIYCLLLAFEEAKRRNFSVFECRKVGINGARCQEIAKVAQMLCNLVGHSFNLVLNQYEFLAKALLQCFPNQVAYLVSNGQKIYQDFYGRKLHLSHQSVVGTEKFVLASQILEKKVKGRITLEMESVSGLDESWIREFFSTKIIHKEETFLDLSTRRVVKRSTEGWGGFVLSISETEEVGQDEKTKAYAEALQRGDLKLKNWNAQVETFLDRKSFLASKYPEYEVSRFDEDTKFLFYQELCVKASTWREIKNLEIYQPLLECFSSEELKLLDEAVPATIDLKMGRRPFPLDYSSKNEVVLRVVLQDLYDVLEHPSIVFGKYPLVLEILAPSRRPVQRTSNLLNFWKTSYPVVRKDLAGRYPKHEWR